MKNVLLYFLAILIVSCSQQTNSDTTDTKGAADVVDKAELEDRAKLVDDIAYLEGDLSSSPDGKMDPTLAKELIEKSVHYATTYKDDPRSPAYLFRSADVAKGLGMPDKAIELWGVLKKSYPDHQKTPSALFLQGFTYENDFNNYEKAKEVYTEFLQLFPDHPLAVQVKAVLKTLGVPPEELVKGFQKK